MIPPMRLSSDLDFFFEPKHQRLVETLTGVASELAACQNQDSKTIMKRLGKEFKLCSWLIPDEGAPLDMRALCLIREMLGQTMPLADALFAVQGLGSYPIVIAGTDRQKKHYLPYLKSGDWIIAFAVTEECAGSDIASLETTATPTSNGYRLSGSKTLISSGGVADYYIVAARIDTKAFDNVSPHQRIGLFIVPSHEEGLDVSPMSLSIDHPIASLSLNDCMAETLIGNEGDGFGLLMKTLELFRLTVGASACGMAYRALQEAITHVQNRNQFGKPLMAQPIVQQYIAQMSTELDAARLLVLRAAYQQDNQHQDAAMASCMAKSYSTEAAGHIVDKAVQLLGGKGVVRGEIVESLYRTVRAMRIYEGTTEIQQMIIGKTVLSKDKQ